MIYFIYHNPQLVSKPFPDAIDKTIVTLGRADPTKRGDMWYLAKITGQLKNAEPIIRSLGYPVKIVEVDTDADIETAAPWARKRLHSRAAGRIPESVRERILDISLPLSAAVIL
ncbi:MAG: hypothetical protein PF440_05070 [Thiomicrorhabdus sp.]|jgi:hypothetical protein|nr:hypothetical protein [Thiomicrorhabdus sp.]